MDSVERHWNVPPRCVNKRVPSLQRKFFISGTQLPTFPVQQLFLKGRSIFPSDQWWGDQQYRYPRRSLS